MSVGSGQLMHARQATVEYTIGYDLPVHSARRLRESHLSDLDSLSGITRGF